MLLKFKPITGKEEKREQLEKYTKTDISSILSKDYYILYQRIIE